MQGKEYKCLLKRFIDRYSINPTNEVKQHFSYPNKVWSVSMANNIFNSFTWSYTREGTRYWYTICVLWCLYLAERTMKFNKHEAVEHLGRANNFYGYQDSEPYATKVKLIIEAFNKKYKLI